MKTEEVKNTIKRNNLLIFTPNDLKNFLGVSKVAAQKLAERYTRRNIFTRLRRNYYVLTSNVPHSFFIANCIYSPSYISLESALSYYGFIPESIYAITSVTFKTTKSFKALNKDFSYTKIKKKAFKGYLKEKIGDNLVLIAEPEKALADYFYLSLLGQKKVSERLSVNNINKEKLFNYLKLFEREKLKEFSKKYL